MLSVSHLVVLYEELRALQDVSLEVRNGDLVALIGSNGAGKTTLLNAISGLLIPGGGQILWRDTSLVGLTPDRICREGIIQVPEGRKLFARMTVKENLEMGAYVRSARRHSLESYDRVLEMFPILSERRAQVAGSLSGGEQQMLAVARAMMAKPKLLMLDEPSLGLAPLIAIEIFRIIAGLNASGLTVFLVSQEVLQTLSIAQFGYVLENGKVALSGQAQQLRDDPRVKESYLGL
jgi:branched-chain amino acid transport system ATP-binding protein